MPPQRTEKLGRFGKGTVAGKTSDAASCLSERSCKCWEQPLPTSYFSDERLGSIVCFAAISFRIKSHLSDKNTTLLSSSEGASRGHWLVKHLGVSWDKHGFCTYERNKCFWMYEKEGIEMSSKIICRFLILLHVQMVALSPEAEILWDYVCLSQDKSSHL